MTNAFLEPTTIESPVPAETPINVTNVATQAAAPGAGIDPINLDWLPQREITRATSTQGKKLGLFGKSFHMLRDASFQIGLSHPGKLWYRDSPALNAKEKATMDAALLGLF